MLLEPHRQKLLACGLTPDTWSQARPHSGSVDEVREVLGYGGAGTGLVIPFGDEAYSRVRIDNPGPDGKRYRSPKGQGNRLYVPPALTDDPFVLGDPSRPLHVTEGEFKALKATQEGFPTIALPGVWSWKTKLHGKSFPIPDLDRIEWKGRRTVVIFDSDLAEKPPVAWAEHALVQELRRRGADVYVLRLPDGPKGAKQGLDDFLVANGPEAFKKLPMHTLAEADKESPTFLRMGDLADAYLLSVARPDYRIRIGYPELDGLMRGVAPGEVLQVLGRSGVGKTMFLLNLLERMTGAGQLPTLLFSLEMQGIEIFERVTSLTTGLPGREIEDRARRDDPDLVEGLADTVRRWEHVVVVERPCTLDQLDGLIEQARAGNFWAEPLRLVCVDYIGLIGHRRPTSPYEETSASSKELKRLAKRHRVGIVSLSQVGREGESGGEPITLHSARDSGVVEEGADYLLGIWRPELSDKLSKDERLARRGQFKVRVLKQRGGPAPRTVTLHFEATNLRVTPPAVAVEAEP